MLIGSKALSIDDATCKSIQALIGLIANDASEIACDDIKGSVLFTGQDLEITIATPQHKMKIICKGDREQVSNIIEEIFNVVNGSSKKANSSNQLTSSNNFVSGNLEKGSFRVTLNKA